MPSGLRDVGVPEEALEGFVQGALSASRLITNNPRVPTASGVLEVYRASW
jgi:alcohol dehydrogenase class IV